jgi:hypothetical protein
MADEVPRTRSDGRGRSAAGRSANIGLVVGLVLGLVLALAEITVAVPFESDDGQGPRYRLVVLGITVFRYPEDGELFAMRPYPQARAARAQNRHGNMQVSCPINGSAREARPVIDRRGCLMLLCRTLLVGGIGYLLAVAIGWAVIWLLRDALAPDPLLVGTIAASILMWPALSFAAWWAVFEFPRRGRERAPREAFLRRSPLTDAAFSGLFPHTATAAVVRAGLRRLVGRSDVADRLLPSDLIRATSELSEVCPDDLDWAEFLLGLESRLGVRLPDEAFSSKAFPDASVAEVVGWCAGQARHAEPIYGRDSRERRPSSEG